MKRGGLLHPQLARIVASLGHGDTLVVADAGLPVPPGVERVDLAFAPGKPALLDVLGAVLAELVVEHAALAVEAQSHTPPALYGPLRDRLAALPGLKLAHVPHAELKRMTAGAAAVVRTGEFTPYANVVLRCGVAF